MTGVRSDLLADLPSLVTAPVRSALPQLRACETMAGRLDVATLKQLGLKSPGVYVSVLGARPGDVLSGPQRIWKMRMAAFVVTRDQAGLHRDDAAASICQVLLELIPEATWGDEDVGPAEGVELQSLVSTATRGMNVALWAVTWTQPLCLSAAPAAESLPIELYVGQEPLVGPDYESDYQQIGGEP